MLVTAGAPVDELAAGKPTAEKLLEEAEGIPVGEVIRPEEVEEPPIAAVLPAGAGALVIGGAEEWVTVGDVWAGMVVAGIVVGAVVLTVPPEDTVMSTEGLPDPQFAVTR
ncbi:MAG TPA: hypothetical protein VFN97_22510 [Actinospica sp.]|nr:hypothetical protein [Actinospica sp.]